MAPNMAHRYMEEYRMYMDQILCNTVHVVWHRVSSNNIKPQGMAHRYKDRVNDKGHPSNNMGQTLSHMASQEVLWVLGQE